MPRLNDPLKFHKVKLIYGVDGAASGQLFVDGVEMKASFVNISVVAGEVSQVTMTIHADLVDIEVAGTVTVDEQE